MGKALKMPLWLSQEMVSLLSLTLTVYNQQLEDTQKNLTTYLHQKIFKLNSGGYLSLLNCKTMILILMSKKKKKNPHVLQKDDSSFFLTSTVVSGNYYNYNKKHTLLN